MYDADRALLNHSFLLIAQAMALSVREQNELCWKLNIYGYNLQNHSKIRKLKFSKE